MNFNSNREILNKDLYSMQEWNNASGDFEMDDAFGDDAFGDDAYDDDGYNSADAGTKAAHSAVSRQRPVRSVTSKPYVFTVTNTNLAGAPSPVQLFGGEANRTAVNYGNPPEITITYDFAAYTAGYVGMIARAESQPLICGLIRVECDNTTQLGAPWSKVDADPTGYSQSEPILFIKAVNQFQNNIIETQTDVEIYGGAKLQYNQLPATSVRVYIYPADVASLRRGLAGKGVVKELKRPTTQLQQNLTIKQIAPSKARS